MSPREREELRAWVKIATAALACEALSYALDRVTLGPSNYALAAWAIVAALTLALRLGLVFVAPGWLLARAIVAWVEARRARPRKAE